MRQITFGSTFIPLLFISLYLSYSTKSIAGNKISNIADTSSRSTAEVSAIPVAGVSHLAGVDTLVKSGFFPLNGTHHAPSFTRETVLRELSGRTVSLITQDRVTLDAVWAPHPKENASAVVIFHGNGGTLDSMLDFGRWFQSQGMSVLMITLRGYPGSGGDVEKDGELGLYLDVDAAMRFILEDQKVPHHKVLAYGYSLGGSLAAAAGYFFDIPVILDHTFTSAREVSASTAEKNISFFIPRGITYGAALSAFPKGKMINEIPVLGYNDYHRRLKTDGLDSLRKMEASSNDMFVIYGLEDNMMSTVFAERFFQAKRLQWKETRNKKSRKNKADRIVPIAGGHWGPFFQNEQVTEKLKQFLKENGLT